MPVIKSLLLISLAVFGSIPGIPFGQSIAQENNLSRTNKVKNLVFIKGNCKNLIVGGSDLTSSCISELRHTSYKIGRGSFAAQLSNGGIISFSGTKDVQTSLSRYTLYLDKILLVWQDSDTTEIQTFSNDIVGSCDLFGNFVKEVSTIKCQSREKDGTVSEFEFVTDGSPPDITRFP
jgi:hypothetical protein